MKSNKLLMPVTAALFSALSAVFVGFIHIPNMLGGYTHVGDAIVYLCASLLPMPYAALSCAVGFAIADLLGGYVYYMLPSALIRIMVVLTFSAKKDKIIIKRNIVAVPFSLLITVGGYAITKYIIKFYIESYTSEAAVAAMIASIPGNVIQCILSGMIFVVVGLALDKSGLKNKYFGGKNHVRK